jgi:glyoxylase-like metal-dependent hydrolase (beta-lactamase superfamily II)
VIVETLTVGPLEENAYLVIDPATREAALVDPGAEPERLVAWVAEHDVTLTAIWLTHAHFDHIGGVAGVTAVHDVPVYLHPLDLPVYARGAQSAARWGLPFEQPSAPSHRYEEGDVLALGDARFTVWHVPGHAPGHVILRSGDVLLGGDLLFAGSIGRVDLPGADPDAMQTSLERVRDLPDSVVVYPGHGPATTVGREKVSNPFLRGAARVVSR